MDSSGGIPQEEVSGLVAIAALHQELRESMPKSGPKELAAFHKEVLEREQRRGKVATATEFDTETMGEATKRVDSILHNPASPSNAPAAPAPATSTRQRRQRSDAGQKRAPEVKPGTVVFKGEMSQDDAQDLLGYFMRTGKVQAAHQMVDCIAKAQKEAQ